MTSSTKLALPDAPRLLIARPDRVGDVIVSTSCIVPIRQAFPRGELHFYAAERMRPLLEHHPALTGFVSSPEEIEELGADIVVHLHPDKVCYAAAYRAGVRVRVGYRAGFLGRYLTQSLVDRRFEGLQHEAGYNFDLLQVIGVSRPATLSPNVHLPGAARDSLRAKLPWPLESTPFAVLNPSAHSPVARWPVEYFLRLADWLRRELNLRPVFAGADASDSLPGHATDYLNLAAKTDLGELGWLLKHACLLVSRNTGTSHLAAAVGCPVVDLFARPGAIYGPTRWRVLSDKAITLEKLTPRRVFESRHAHWRRSYAAISIGEVQTAVIAALSMRNHAV